MNKHSVPAAPQPSFGRGPTNSNSSNLQRPAAQRSASASKPLAPLDAAFLSRTYVTAVWFGTILTLSVYGYFGSFLITCSFAGGVALAALLLKSQEIFVRRTLRPKGSEPYQGWDAKIPVLLLVALKYIVVGAAFAFLLNRQLMNPLALIAGFLTLQVVIFSKVASRLIAHKLPPINPVNEDYVSKV